jgi:hypothetical protein
MDRYLSEVDYVFVRRRSHLNVPLGEAGARVLVLA